jgi:GNAT superfamily N-acetyltransferase
MTICVQELGDDLLNIRPIYESAFDEDIRVPWSRIEHMLANLTRALVFWEEEKIAGFVMWTPNRVNDSVFIDYFCVSPAFQGRGLGRKYLSWITEILEISFKTILLDCKKSIVPFYENAGFVTVHNAVHHGVPLAVMCRTSTPCKSCEIIAMYEWFMK